MDAIVRHSLSRVVPLLLATTLLAGCADVPLPYAAVQATASVTGCWPGRYPTPVAWPTTALVTDALGVTTTVTLPTATPLPLCPPELGVVATPLPTPIPAPKPYPTMQPQRPQNTSAQQTTFTLPGRAYQLDLAVHPTENWAAVGVMHRQSLLDDPIQLFVRVFDPTAKRWGIAQQVDVGPSSAGRDPNGSIAVAISGDRTVHAIWGASDEDGGLWTSQSRNYGTTWSEPTRIATGCTSVADAAATVDGQLVVLAICGRLPAHPTLIVRRADGTWLPQQELSVPGFFGSLVVIGDGPDARAVAFVTGHGAGMDTHTAFLISGSLSNRTWQVQRRALDVPGDYFFRPQGLAFSRPRPDGNVQQGIVFTWKGQYSPSLYALTSLDAGRSWGEVEAIVGGDDATSRAAQDHDVAFVAPAYAPVSDQLLALWTCCGKAEDIAAATHYASVSTPGGGRWQPHDPTGAVPLVLGSRSAGATVTGQALGAGDVWVAWIEQERAIHVRSVPVVQLIPEVPR